jgi:hypothetical protein
MDKETQEFCHKYDAHVGPSTRMHRRVRRTTIQDWASVDLGTAVRDTIEHDHIPCVEIHMPADRFRALMEHDAWLEREQRRGDGFIGANVVRMVREHERECRLRHEHPGVQAAWEQYQIMLRMVDPGG